MKAGDTVQVQQQDAGPHWIYATVIGVNPDGSAFVQIRHPGNRDQGQMQTFAADQIRTKAAVEALLAATPPPSRDEKRSLQSQAEWLS